MLQTGYLYNKYSALFLKIGALILYVGLSCLYLNNKQTLPIFVDIFFFLFFLDYKNILNLKNYYCVYVFLIFKLSSRFWFPEDYALTFDGTLFFTAFLIGYEIKNVFSDNVILDPKINNVVYETYITKLTYLIKLFAVLKIFLLIVLIAQYGISGFYSGKMLADSIRNYGRASFLDTIITIYTAFINTFLMATIALYIKYKSALAQKPDYYLLSIVMLVLPLLFLSRAYFSFNLIGLLAIYAYFNNSMKKIYFFVIPAALLLMLVSTYIGLLRLNSYDATADFDNVTSNEQFFTELTPIIPYKGTKDNIHILKYQYGKTIFLPLLTKVIPRSSWTTKPENSSAYYLKEFDFFSFEAGFSMPLMLFGDLYLNFGMVITVLIILIFGVVISKMNLIYRNKNYRYIDIYFILFLLFYPVLRNNVPESVLYLLLAFFAMKCITFFVLKISPNQNNR